MIWVACDWNCHFHRWQVWEMEISTWSEEVRNKSDIMRRSNLLIQGRRLGRVRGSNEDQPLQKARGWCRLLKDAEKTHTEQTTDVDLLRSCHSNHLDFSRDSASVSNSRKLETQKYFHPFILGTDPFPDHCHIQQMYSKDGFVTRLLTALQMYVANYITTCSCTEGNISAPAGAHTQNEDAWQQQLQALAAEGWNGLDCFPFWGS